MAEQQIQCPHCKKSFPLTDAITHQIKAEYDVELQLKLKKKEEEFSKKEQLWENEKKKIEVHTEELLEKERLKAEADAKKKAEKNISLQLTDLQEQLKEKDDRIKKAEKSEIELRKQQRLLQEEKEKMKLEVERTLDRERQKIKDESLKIISQEFEFKLKEKDLKFEEMKKQAEELKRKLEQGSVQTQGEVQELALEAILRTSFPLDEIVEVKKGERGADVMQKVRTTTGQECGTILYESKRTKNWGKDWIDKLKADTQEAKANISVLVSEAMPEGIDTFGQYEGVWVTKFQYAKALALVLREGMIAINSVMLTQSNKGTKMESLYNYLTSNEFKTHIEFIVEGFSGLQDSLQTEKRRMEIIWSEREKQLNKVLKNTLAFYGSIRGIAGEAVPKIGLLEE